MFYHLSTIMHLQIVKIILRLSDENVVISFYHFVTEFLYFLIKPKNVKINYFIPNALPKLMFSKTI